MRVGGNESALVTLTGNDRTHAATATAVAGHENGDARNRERDAIDQRGAARNDGLIHWPATPQSERKGSGNNTPGAASAASTTTRHSILTDVHGTPQMLLTPSGAIAGHTRSDVWGSEQSQSGTQTRIGHTGYLKDPILVDQLHAQARQYTPTLGRFTTRDPWTGDRNNPITLNKYLAFNGNPGSLVDSTGEYPEPGHYYTTYIAVRNADVGHERAARIALYSQLPDEIASLDAITQQVATVANTNYRVDRKLRPIAPNQQYISGAWVIETKVPNEFTRDMIHPGMHNLSGSEEEPMLSAVATDLSRRTVLAAQSDEATGFAIHPFADAYAHRQMGNEEHMYYKGWGHGGDRTVPDMIVMRPELYIEYATDLTKTIAAREGRTLSQKNIEDFQATLRAVIKGPAEALKRELDDL